MERMPETVSNSCTMVVVGVMLAALVVHPAAASDETAADDATWYFIGESNAPSTQFDPRFDSASREPFLTLDDADAAAPRYEFVLTLSDDSNPDRLRFTSGQSQGLAGQSEMYTFLVNRTFDWTNESPITPHFMAGLGMTYTYTDDQGVADLAQRSGGGDQSSWKPAFQFGVGASYEISPSWALTARYRALFVGSDPRTFDEDGSDALFTQDFMIGAQIRF